MMEGMFLVIMPTGFANVGYTFAKIFVQMKLVF
jgi:hypothetical protein